MPTGDAAVPDPESSIRSALEPAAPRASAHHSSEGRNVVASTAGHTGGDIFFAAVQMSRMPMVLADAGQPDMPLVFVNQAFLEMTGYKEADILGRNCRFLQGAATDPAEIARLRAAIAAREDISVELYNYRRDGTGFWNALYLSPVFSPDGALRYYFGSQLDVTRRREAETVLRQSQRTETLGAMASGIAHEFNNLLTVVLANIEPIGRDADERTRGRLARAGWAIRRATRLTQQMLSFARRQFLNAHPIDLRLALRDIDALVNQVSGPEIVVHVHISPQPIPARVDAGQLEVALLQLIRNSVDAMPDGGRLTLSADVAHATPEDPARPEARGFVELRVADTGHGMTPDIAARAPEPFFTTRPQGFGEKARAGLGLSMVKGFTEQSGGRLQLDSTPGEGTIARLILPRHDHGRS